MTNHILFQLQKATRTTARLIRQERGTATIEYGLIAALMAVTAIQAMSSLGGTTSETLEEVGAAMAQEDAAPTPLPSPDGP